MSRLGKIIEGADKAFEHLKKQSAVDQQVADAGDAFELAARAALGAWEARGGMRPIKTKFNALKNEAYIFQHGYQTACGELAVVLRAMRRGEPPSKAELELIQDEIEKVMNE